MTILMVSNTYLPIVGGLENSIEAFSREYRRAGHRTVIVAPAFEGQPAEEEDVVRVPALKKVSGTGYSLGLPAPRVLARALRSVTPAVVHSHHPFLLGGTALRLAATCRAPLVFTYHTMYEKYAYMLPRGDSPLVQQFLVELAAGYANLCDQVIAPSRGIAALLRERGVQTPIEVIPTGIDLERFRDGDGRALRARLGIPAQAPVVGHVGRLTPEKNLGVLAEGVARLLAGRPEAHFLLVGEGPLLGEVQERFGGPGLKERLHTPGVLRGQELADAYGAMDVFAFTSLSETQGIVLAEALAAGVPVVAVAATGVSDVVRDGENGWLLPDSGAEGLPQDLAAALDRLLGLPAKRRAALGEGARRSAEPFAVAACAARALQLYSRAACRGAALRPEAGEGSGRRRWPRWTPCGSGRPTSPGRPSAPWTGSPPSAPRGARLAVLEAEAGPHLAEQQREEGVPRVADAGVQQHVPALPLEPGVQGPQRLAFRLRGVAQAHHLAHLRRAKVERWLPTVRWNVPPGSSSICTAVRAAAAASAARPGLFPPAARALRGPLASALPVQALHLEVVDQHLRLARPGKSAPPRPPGPPARPAPSPAAPAGSRPGPSPSGGRAAPAAALPRALPALSGHANLPGSRVVHPGRKTDLSFDKGRVFPLIFGTEGGTPS